MVYGMPGAGLRRNREACRQERIPYLHGPGLDDRLSARNSRRHGPGVRTVRTTLRPPGG
jgi:hypothetical protein